MAGPTNRPQNHYKIFGAYLLGAKAPLQIPLCVCIVTKYCDQILLQPVIFFPLSSKK